MLQSLKCRNWHHWTQRRSISSKNFKWGRLLTRDLKKEIEEKWQNKLDAQSCQNTQDEAYNAGKKYYVLSMFPYPSGNLHIGHVRVYTISDIMARYQRLNGKTVIHPMGWDAFGLPAENAAIERGEEPQKWTHSNIKRMKSQLKSFCYSFDWDREFATCDPEYYKWTQYLFLKMHEHGLVYQKKGLVNWDPVDQTVLADEQVDENGCSWRSGAQVERKYLKQWYLRTTAYSKSLYDGLSEVDPKLWKHIISIQKDWIGKCDGLSFNFEVCTSMEETCDDPLTVFTRHGHCVHGISHILISNQHLYNHPQYYHNGYDKSHDVIPLKLLLKNPFTEEFIPVFVHQSFDFGDTRDSHVGVPAVDEADKLFALSQNIAYKEVYDSKNDCVINSNELTGMPKADALQAVSEMASVLGCGGYITSEKSRDWLISRQRYWGTPIPIIHCPKYGTLPARYEDLPVVLPQVSGLHRKGGSLLRDMKEWSQVKCHKCDCDSFAVRETDTMDTFVDSSWYYLRYTDPHNSSQPFSKDTAFQQLPVDLYIGGIEHAKMHLYYTRFFHHFLNDLGLTPTREPFINLLTQGMVNGQTFRVKQSGKYVAKEQVDFSGTFPVEKSTGLEIITEWEKMSKSKYNGVDPQEVLDKYGIDTTRLCIVSGVAPKTDRDWSDDMFVGVERFLNRIWNLVVDFIESKEESVMVTSNSPVSDEQLFEARNLMIKQVDIHMNKTFVLNAAISHLQSYTNALLQVPNSVKASSYEFERALCDLIIVMSPFVPLLTSEMWSLLSAVEEKKTTYDWNKSVLEQSWPTMDKDFNLKLRVKLNSKYIYQVAIPTEIDIKSLTKHSAFEIAQSDPTYMEVVKGFKPTRVQFQHIPGDVITLNLIIDELNEKKQKKSMKKSSA